jgi:hypothetical protein
MTCRHFGSTGRCNLFSHCRKDSLSYDRDGRCITGNYGKRPVDSLNCDEEGYCLTESDDKYPDDSCDNYEL